MGTRKLTVYKEAEAELVVFEKKYEVLVIDCSSPKGMKAAKDSRKEIRDARSNLEDLRKVVKKPILLKAQDVDDQATAIKDRLTVLFLKFDKAIKDVEKAKEIAAKKVLDAALEKEQELTAREAAIVAKEIELGLREPLEEDEPEVVEENHNEVEEKATKTSKVSKKTHASNDIPTICEPHIKAAAERLGTLRKIRDLVFETDAQPEGKIDEAIATKHDEVLGKIWDIVDELK